MAEIVLGLGSSHSPQVSSRPQMVERAGIADQKRTPYESATPFPGGVDGRRA